MCNTCVNLLPPRPDSHSKLFKICFRFIYNHSCQSLFSIKLLISSLHLNWKGGSDAGASYKSCKISNLPQITEANICLCFGTWVLLKIPQNSKEKPVTHPDTFWTGVIFYGKSNYFVLFSFIRPSVREQFIQITFNIFRFSLIWIRNLGFHMGWPIAKPLWIYCWKYLCWSLFLVKLVKWKMSNLYLQLWHRCFPLNFAKFHIQVPEDIMP